MTFLRDVSTPTERELVVGIYDLTGYTRFCERAEPLRAFDLMMRYTAVAARIVDEAGGRFIKPMADAGLFAFPLDAADAAVTAVLRLQAEGDPWLAAAGYDGRAIAALHAGPVATGPMSWGARTHLDVIGKAVNIVAAARRRECSLVLTPALFRKLTPAMRKRFRKHTPPVVYILGGDPRPG
jgi:class 3 adenylate cyclase